MAPYIYKRNSEGVHIINLAKTWEKLMLAARIIAAIPNKSDVLVLFPHISLSIAIYLTPMACYSCLSELYLSAGASHAFYRSCQTESTLKEEF